MTTIKRTWQEVVKNVLIQENIILDEVKYSIVFDSKGFEIYIEDDSM